MPKKTKAQLEEERLAREEEERKAKILEDKRRAEEAEKKRLEDLRIQAENKAYREAELQRLKEEQQAIFDEILDRKAQLKAEETFEMAKLEWNLYKDPSDYPEYMTERDLNTFFSTNADAPMQAINDALESSKGIDRVAAAIEDRWSDCLANYDFDGQKREIQYLKQCNDIILQKMDAATAHILRFSDIHVNDRTELQIDEINDRISFGMWGSFSEMRPIRKSVQLEKVGIQLDIPKQILHHDAWYVFRVIRLPFETFSLSHYHTMAASLEAQNKYVVGDVVMIDILKPPAQSYSLRAKKWTIRDRSTQAMALQKSYYSSTAATRVLLKIPETIVMSDDITLCCWDESTQNWTADGITDFQYSESNHQVQFYTTVVGAMALVKNRDADMPYKKWSVCPVREVGGAHGDFVGSEFYERRVRLNIVTQKIDLAIDIIGTKAKLIKPNTKQLSDLIGVEMTPGCLLKKLQHRGINLLPLPAAVCSPESITKDDVLEMEVLREVARGASSFDFEGSAAWNTTIPSHQIGILCRETSAYMGNLDTFDYECILAELDEKSTSCKNAPDVGGLESPAIKYTLVMGNEYGSKKGFLHTPRPNEVSHCNIKNTMVSRVMPYTLQRISDENVRLEKTVFSVLRMLRPFSYNI